MSIFPSNRIVATLATKYAFEDLQLFMESLQQFECQNPPDLYIYQEYVAPLQRHPLNRCKKQIEFSY